MYGTKLTMDQMCEIGLMCGSDIPFMLKGGTRRVQGTGDIVLPAPQMPHCHFVICMPSKGVSTPQAYANYDAMGIKTKVETEKLIKAISDKNLQDIAKYMANDLETAAGSEDTQPLKAKLLELGAIGSMMTGSGAAVFGIFDDEQKAINAANALRPDVRSVFVARPVTFGASVKKKKR